MKTKKIFKAIIAFIIIIAVFTSSVSAAGYTNILDDLKSLVSTLGTESGYNFDSMPTRAEAAVILVKLLGKESEAIEMNYTHPFTDVPEWADPYVGYLYENNITNGIGDNKFGSDDLCDINMFCVFLLRALGFTEDNGDFTYDNAVDFAANLVFMYGNMFFGESIANFNLDDLASMIYNALPEDNRDEYITLIGKLLEDNNIDLGTDAGFINKIIWTAEVNQLMKSLTESDKPISYSADYETVSGGVKANANLIVSGEDYAANVTFNYNNIDYKITEYGKDGYIYLDNNQGKKIKHNSPYDSIIYTSNLVPMLDFENFPGIPVDEVKSIEKTISDETITYKIIPAVGDTGDYYTDGVLILTSNIDGELISLSVNADEYYDGELESSMKVNAVFGDDIKIDFPDFSDYEEVTEVPELSDYLGIDEN